MRTRKADGNTQKFNTRIEPLFPVHSMQFPGVFIVTEYIPKEFQLWI